MFLLALWHGSLFAGPLVVVPSGAYVPLAAHFDLLEDSTAKMSLEDVLRQPRGFQSIAGSASGNELNFGYSGSAYWLRLDVHNPDTRPADLLLEIAFPSLDSVTAYLPDGQGGYRTLATGDLLAFSARPISHRNFVFPLVVPESHTQTLYLRIASAGTLTIPARLWKTDAFYHSSQNAYALHCLYFGMLLALGLYNLMLYAAVGDRSYLYYVLYGLGMGLGMLSLNGLGNEYLWPDWPAWGNLAFSMGFDLTGLFGILFTRSFLDAARTLPRWLDRTLKIFTVTFAALFLLAPVLPYHWTGIPTSVLGAPAAVLCLVSGVVAHRRGHPSAGLFLTAWVFLLVSVALMALRNLAVLPTMPVTTYSMQIGSAIEMLLLSFALATRVTRLQKDKEAAQEAALQAHHEALETARRAERDLELRVRTRTRALEDANARLSSQEELLRRLAQHDPLTGLANRLLLEDRLQQSLRHAERRQDSCVVLLIDLDGFKPINDTHGHAAGDQILTTVAQRLLDQVRVTDTVARLGGDEFVVVLDDLEGSDDASSVAQKIVDAVSADITVGRLALNVTASVGIARWPDDGRTVSELLRAADQAMYIAKSRGRNGYASLPPHQHGALKGGSHSA